MIYINMKSIQPCSVALVGFRKKKESNNEYLNSL